MEQLDGNVVSVVFRVYRQPNGYWTKSVEVSTDKGESVDTYSETKTLDVDVLIGELESL